jgi:hypothetical protein
LALGIHFRPDFHSCHTGITRIVCHQQAAILRHRIRHWWTGRLTGARPPYILYCIHLQRILTDCSVHGVATMLLLLLLPPHAEALAS